MFEFIKNKFEARRLAQREQEKEIIETIPVAGAIHYSGRGDLVSRVFLVPTIDNDDNKRLVYKHFSPGLEGTWQTFVDVKDRKDNYVKVLYKKKNKANDGKTIIFIQLDMHISHPDDSSY